MDLNVFVLAAFAVLVAVLLVVIVRQHQRLSDLKEDLWSVRGMVDAQRRKIAVLSDLVAGQAGLRGAAGPLVTHLNDEDPMIRGAVAETLVRMGQPAADPLLAVLKEKSVPVEIAADVLDRLDFDLDIGRFLSLPLTLQRRFLPLLRKKPLNPADLLRLCASPSSEVQDFVFAHEKTDASVLRALAHTGPAALREKLVGHPCFDESVVAELADTDLLGAVITHDRLPEPVKAAARRRIQEIIDQRRREEEEEAASDWSSQGEAQEPDYEPDRTEEDFGRGMYSTGCGGC